MIIPYIVLFVFVFLFYLLCIGGLKRLAERLKLGFREYLVAVFIAGMLFWLALRWILSPPLRRAILGDWKAAAVLIAGIIAAVFVEDKI